MNAYERAVFAVERLWHRIGWHLWRKRRRPNAMGTDLLAALEAHECEGCIHGH